MQPVSRPPQQLPQYRRYRGTAVLPVVLAGTVGTAVPRHRERKLLALPTLDMYLPLSERTDGLPEKRSRRSNRGVYGLSFLGEICCSRTSELEARPITCHMDPTSEQAEIHLQVEGHLMDARVQGG